MHTVSTRAEEQPALPGFLPWTAVKLRATSTRVTKLSEKCNVQRDFIFNFTQICKFKRSFNRLCSFSMFFTKQLVKKV